MPDVSPPEDAGYEWMAGNDVGNPPQRQAFSYRVQQPRTLGGLGGVITEGRREAEMQFTLALKLWRWTPYIGPDKPGAPVKVFTCATDNSRLIPLPIEIVNPPPGLQGPFIESVRVQMGFDDPRALLIVRSPDTDQQSGSATSSVSYSFNGGFFGVDPTASVSAEYSHSHTIDLTAFGISSQSDERRTDHTMKLTMLGDGRQYTDWRNAGKNPVPPQRAVSDMPLGMQGLWHLPGDLADTLNFRVTVTATFVTLPDAWEGWQVSQGGPFPMPRLNEGPPREPPWDTGLQSVLQWVQYVPIPLKAVDKAVPNRR